MIRLREVTMFLYFIREYPDGPIKIGIAQDPLRRLATLQSGSPRRLVLELAVPGGHGGPIRRMDGGIDGESAKATERGWHERFGHIRLLGEWFEPDDDLLTQIESLRRWSTEQGAA